MTLTVIFLQFFFAYTVTITDHFGPNYVLIKNVENSPPKLIDFLFWILNPRIQVYFLMITPTRDRYIVVISEISQSMGIIEKECGNNVHYKVPFWPNDGYALVALCLSVIFDGRTIARQ